jgi:P27 family predicted phage terminase small subunit
MNPPTPTALKILRGNPGKRPINQFEPKPEDFKAEPPEHLDSEAIKEWGRLVPILQRMRILTEADEIALANLCVSYSTLIQAQKQLAKAGLLYKTHTGHVQVSPLLTIVHQSMIRVGKLLNEFGLTPSSRTRIQVDPRKASAEDEWEARDRRMNESA